MALYSASQLLGKTILLNKRVNVYSVFDLNANGDNSKPIGTLDRGDTFVIDSFLAQTTGYVSSYGIKYAPRKTPYFTFYQGGAYNAVAIIADGRFSVNALKDQGALNVKEEIEAAKAAEAEDTFLGTLFKGAGFDFSKIKGVLIAVLFIILAIYLLPVVLRGISEARK
jgi:hypothetical protein